MKKTKRLGSLIVAVVFLFALFIFSIPSIAASEEQVGVMIADTANRSVTHPFGSPSGNPWDFDNFYVEGGEPTSWLWTTNNTAPAIFKFDLPNDATSFEPWFEGEDYAGTFTIYASKNKTDWLPVAKMSNTYTKNLVYNSTSDITPEGYEKSTDGNEYDELNQTNITAVLADNASKIVYLKVGDIVSAAPDEWGSRIQLRSFGLTYAYDGGDGDGDGGDGDGTGGGDKPPVVHEEKKVEYRLDASPLTYDGAEGDPENFEQMKENWKTVSKKEGVVSDEKARLASAWAKTIDPFGNGEVYMNVDSEGFVVYEFDLDDRTTSFTIGGWGAYRDMNIVASKDGKTWYTIADMNDKSTNLGSVDLPKNGNNSDQCKKNIEWILTGNPNKKFLVALVAGDNDPQILYANIILNATVNTGTDTSKDLPTTVPAGYTIPKAFVKPAHFTFTMNYDGGSDNSGGKQPSTGEKFPIVVVSIFAVSGISILALIVSKKKSR